MSTTPTGRGWAYAGAIIGGALSVAANVAHSYIATDPPALKVIFSASWSVLLFVGIEVVARVAFPPGIQYVALRFVGLGGVSLVAGIVSYQHMSGLFEHWGLDWATVHLGPLAVDGFLAICSAALILTAAKRARVEPSAERAKPTFETLFPHLAALRDEDAVLPAETAPAALVAPAPIEATPEPSAVPPWADDAPGAPAPDPEPEPEPEAPKDPRYVTEIVFTEALPEPGDPRRYPEIRRRAEMLNEENPARSQQVIADLIEIPRRTLRDALAATAPKPATPPKLELVHV
ncbi:hypothetical protein CA850_29600 [Micromonospora echinospora]|uniref:DUF2637 domain-containing protein n=1 Tax=Micromonospora echinospora TaxID=1877 RepID=A0A1C4U4U5_MICEC|nr:hypothetical protein [Micromonospora echinospora]OZV74735.1 hypothetical protein CA850_29600 [Micromonospora echinospora]SCE66674.1 hypothetical protein GA0070618_0014 [Micromonospora echinospora]SCF42595.1 hypothetical protein GA0070618_6684 [Micromonospora echinospora]